jgi:hypothetical protein
MTTEINEPTADVTVTILTDGDVTVVKAGVILDYDSNSSWFSDYEVVESSRRNPGDPENDEIGVKLAVGRAIRSLGRMIHRDAQESVREQAEREDKQREAAERAALAKAARAAEIRLEKQLEKISVPDYNAWGNPLANAGRHSDLYGR